MNFAIPAARFQFIFILLAFVCLIVLFVESDFSVALVAQNSHTLKPLIYKISGVWGNHEGSMLLWILILALFGLLVGEFGKNIPSSLRARVLSVPPSIAIVSRPLVRLCAAGVAEASSLLRVGRRRGHVSAAPDTARRGNRGAHAPFSRRSWLWTDVRLMT